ncbi:MAG: hypothetical protein IJ643_05150 [Eubacterium sp.]|nr:hypothetical protein [Eubacterium sp.]
MNIFIAADIGHGESAGALALFKMNEGKVSHEVKRLSFKNGKPTVYSRIFITEEQMKALSQMGNITYSKLSSLGEFLIGNFAKQLNKPGESFQYFKVQPSRFNDRIIQGEYTQKYNITHAMVMSCFIYQLFNELLENNPNDLMDYQRANATFLVGCPTSSAWTDDENKAAYIKLIKDATGVKESFVIAESTAAIFSSIQYNTSSVSADKGAVIFDFGSSTADCTYMWMGRKIEEFSWRLGASEIETALFSYLINKYNSDFSGNEISTDQIINDSLECTRILRGNKEEYFETQNELVAALTFNKTADSPTRAVPAIVDKATMEAVVKGAEISIKDNDNQIRCGSWYALCKDFFVYSKERISGMTSRGEKCPLSSVVITGGASRMPFVYELCKSVFPECEIFIEKTPSYSVSNGLCWAEIAESNVDECLERIVKQIEENSICKTEYFIEKLSDKIMPTLLEIISVESTEWGQSESDLSVRNLINRISEKVSSSEIELEIRKLLSESEKEWTQECMAVINDAVKNEVESLYCSKVPSYINAFKNTNAVELNKIAFDFGPIVNSLCQSLINGLQKFAIELAIWVIAVLVATIPVIGPVIGVVLMLMAEGIAEDVNVPNSELDKPRSASTRARLANKLSKKVSGNDNKTNAKIKENIKDGAKKDGVIDESALSDGLREAAKNTLEILLLKKFDD